MSASKKILLAAWLGAGVLASAQAVTIDLKPEVGTQSWWGNSTHIPLVGSYQGTKSFDFWWTGQPDVGGLFLGADALSTGSGAVGFSNLLLWRCGQTCNDLTPITPGNAHTSWQSFNGNLTDGFPGRDLFYMDVLTVDSGHFLFSFDVHNTMLAPTTLTAKVGVFPVTPVPEPGTWALMLGGLGVLGWVARRRRSAAVGQA